MHGQTDNLVSILWSILISKAMAKAKDFDVLGLVTSSCFVKLYELFMFLKYVYNMVITLSSEATYSDHLQV